MPNDRKPSPPGHAAPTGAIEADPRWSDVLSRNAAADGQFVYGVTTTGVYARPSSAARLPRPENVVFFTSAEQAEAAGYRPSRRHAADRSSASALRDAWVASTCRHIEAAEQLPSLSQLAQAVGMSPAHFQRSFKSATGLSPKGYAEAQRARRLREALSAPKTSVTAAIHEAGLGANGRFYEDAERRLGMKPARYKQGGMDEEIRFAVGECALGAILVAESRQGICAIAIGDDAERLVHELQDRFSRARLIGADPVFEARVATVIGFVEAPGLGLSLPLDVRGTAFQERVWRALRDIPPGSTVTYAQVAERIGAPDAARAVAQACGANRLAVAIPCHRVVASNGTLSGYRWGVERKRALLDKEKI